MKPTGTKPGSGCAASSWGYNQRNDSKEQKKGREPGGKEGKGEGEEGRKKKERNEVRKKGKKNFAAEKYH